MIRFTKQKILIAITVLMVCVFCLVGCEIADVEIPFFSKSTAEVETDNQTPLDEAQTSEPDGSTTAPGGTTIPVTTTKPVQTTPSIENGGANTVPGYAPLEPPVS